MGQELLQPSEGFGPPHAHGAPPSLMGGLHQRYVPLGSSICWSGQCSPTKRCNKLKALRSSKQPLGAINEIKGLRGLAAAEAPGHPAMCLLGPCPTWAWWRRNTMDSTSAALQPRDRLWSVLPGSPPMGANPKDTCPEHRRFGAERHLLDFPADKLHIGWETPMSPLNKDNITRGFHRAKPKLQVRFQYVHLSVPTSGTCRAQW